MAMICYEEFETYAKEYQLVPIVKEVYSDMITPIAILRRLAKVNRNYFLLESVEGGERVGRYSFLGYDPLLRISCEQGEVQIKSGGIKTTRKGNPITVLKNVVASYRSPKRKELPTFTGGFVGYFSYEMIGYTESKVECKQSEFPIFDLLLFDKVIVFDHLKQKVLAIVNAKTEEGKKGYEGAILELEKLLCLLKDSSPLPVLTAQEEVQFECNMSKEMYCNRVEQTKQYIYEGDIFQGVISRCFQAEYHSSLLNTYRVMRTINPSPYMYFIQCEETQIAGVSPETMVKLVDGQLTTFPVAGTRRRGLDEEEDMALEKELLADEKEVAEHNMLVDLARNDIGKLAKLGTVSVKEYKKIHRFSKVMHIASVVCGELNEEQDGIDTITTMLPAGTLSGAPKIRACQIIEELEPQARGIYGGAIGYLDLSGNLDVCIAIRTAVKKQNTVYVQAGAGIVADSVPEKEYEECANKASAIMEAIKRASEVNAV